MAKPWPQGLSAASEGLEIYQVLYSSRFLVLPVVVFPDDNRTAAVRAARSSRQHIMLDPPSRIQVRGLEIY